MVALGELSGVAVLMSIADDYSRENLPPQLLEELLDMPTFQEKLLGANLYFPYFVPNNRDPHGRAVISVALTTYAVGKGVSNLILAAVYAKYCLECNNRAIETANKAAEGFKKAGDPSGFAQWLRTAKPGTECTELCTKAGEHGVKGLKWVICGIVIKYGIKRVAP